MWDGSNAGSTFDVHGNAITGNGGGIHYRKPEFGSSALSAPVAPTTKLAERSGGTVVASGRVPALTQAEAKRFFGRIDVYASTSCEAGPQGAVPIMSVRVGGPVYDGTWQSVLHGIASSLDVITPTVTIVLHSKPKRLKTLQAGKNGKLSGKVKIPKGTKAAGIM